MKSGAWTWGLTLLITLLPAQARAWDPVQEAGRAAARGQRALAAGDTTEAIRNLMAAQALEPENERIRMGLGEALYEATDYASARRQYESLALSPEGEYSQAALYNAGNAAFDAGDLQGALDLYTRALLDAGGTAGEDLRHNLELAQRLLEQQQEQEQPQDGEGEDQQDQEDQQQSEEQQQEQDQQQSDEQQQQQQQEQESEGQPEEEQSPEAQPEEEQTAEDQGEQTEQPAEGQQMTEEEAMRLLQALDADEAELRKSIQRRLRGEEKATEHDW